MSAGRSGEWKDPGRPDRVHPERGVPWLDDGAKQFAPGKLRAANGRHCQLSDLFGSQPFSGCGWIASALGHKVPVVEFGGRSKISREL